MLIYPFTLPSLALRGHFLFDARSFAHIRFLFSSLNVIPFPSVLPCLVNRTLPEVYICPCLYFFSSRWCFAVWLLHRYYFLPCLFPFTSPMVFTTLHFGPWLLDRPDLSGASCLLHRISPPPVLLFLLIKAFLTLLAHVRASSSHHLLISFDPIATVQRSTFTFTLALLSPILSPPAYPVIPFHTRPSFPLLSFSPMSVPDGWPPHPLRPAFFSLLYAMLFLLPCSSVPFVC